MSLPRWNASLELGVPEIDSDHQHLVELVQKLTELSQGEADHEEIWSVLVALETYTQQHFIREEQLMRDIHHEFYTQHKAEHDRMTHDVRNIIDDFLANKVGVGEILNFLSRWLIVHISGSDTLLAKELRLRR